MCIYIYCIYFLNSGEMRVYWQEPKLFQGNCPADAAAVQATSKSERYTHIHIYVAHAINWRLRTCHTYIYIYICMYI